MPLVADRVMETSTTTGTGTLTLAGAKTGYRAFTSAFSTGAKVYYCITDGTDWEVGVGTFTTAGTTLSRDSIFASSNAGSAVNWAAGTRDVFCTAPMQSVVGTPVIQGKAAAYTVAASDNGSIINCTSGTFTVSLTAAATLGSGFTCWIWNTSTTATDAITIDPNSSETIDGLATLVLRRGEGFQIVCNGTAWLTGDKKTMRGYAENYPAADARPVASANRSTAIGVNSGGGSSQAVTSAGAMALGGSYASGVDSFAVANADNSGTYGAQSTNAVAIGFRAKATVQQSMAIGNSVSATGTYSIAMGGGSMNAAAIADATGAISIGDTAASNGIQYRIVFGNYRAQNGKFLTYAVTTDATPTKLLTNISSASATNQITLPNNCAYAFTGMVVARQQAAGGTASAAWKVEGLIRREGTAASTTLVTSTVTAISNVPGWTLALSADTTNGCLVVTGTGAAATNLRWASDIETIEIIYA